MTPSHPALLTSTNSLLLIIDQQDKLSVAMPPVESEAMTLHTLKLGKAARLLDIPVLLTEQYPKGLGPTNPAVSGLVTDIAHRFTKTSFSCCAAEGFMEALEKLGRQQLVLAGQEAHVCVLQTALALLQKGFMVTVVEDAICSRQSRHKANALQRMQHYGVTISNYESVLFEWLRDARHPAFKEISGLVR